jgi:hypothetical protein
MAQHEIRLKIPQRIEVVNKDIEVVVYADGERFGRVRISRGSIDWTPANGKNSKHMNWDKFANVMKREGKPHGVHS